MDELEEDEAGETVDVAALMGFGAFGDQHRGKRRRYHGRTEEAVVDGDPPSTSGMGKGRGKGNKGSGSGSGSGSNNLPLGTGRPRPRPNRAGVVRTDGNDDSDNDTPQNNTSHNGGGQKEAAIRKWTVNASAPESPTHAFSPPNELAPPSTETDKLAPTPTPTQIPRPTSGGDTSLPPKPPLPSLSHSSGKAQAPTTSGTGTRIGTGKEAENEAWKLRKGIRLANGDVAYYDASFVEDPWRGLR